MEKEYKIDNNTKIYRVLYGSNNVFLICTKTKTMLVDTAQPARRNKLFNRLSQLKETQNGIDYLCLTHTHFDHCRNAKAIKDKYNTKVIVGEGEAKSLSEGFTILPKGTNHVSNFLSHNGNKIPSRFSYSPVEADIKVHSSFIPPDMPEIKVFLSPGHTASSISVIVGDKIALCGDNLFSILPNRVYSPFSDDSKRMIKMWKEYLNTKCDLFLPGHGKAISRAFLEKEYRKYAKKFSLV